MMNAGIKSALTILLASVCLPAVANYLFIAGSAFTPRSSSQTVTYPGGGCLFSDDAVTTDLQLPQGATIEGVRLFYSSNDSEVVSLRLTRYDGVGYLTNILNEDSSLSGGYREDYFSTGSTEVIDNLAYSYALISTMGSTANALCGMRVFYSEP